MYDTYLCPNCGPITGTVGTVGGYGEHCFACDSPVKLDTRPIVELERNNAGRLFIGLTELDDRGYGVRAAVLADQGPHVADEIMVRRYRDIIRLMGDNVRSSR